MVIIPLFLILVSCNRKAAPDTEVESIDSVEQDNVEVENKRSTVYGCPVHSEVISEKPGICSICERTLVKRTS